VLYSRQARIFYRCNRSGHVDISDENRKRTFKPTVSIKTNQECASHMTLDVLNGSYNVSFCTTHTVHNDDENLIHDQVKQGIPAKRILRSIRNNSEYGTEGMLVSRQDIDNIIGKNNENEFKLHNDNAESVRCFVEKDNSTTVFLYKPVGSEDPLLPGISTTDFVEI
jgi:hypothetical protein